MSEIHDGRLLDRRPLTERTVRITLGAASLVGVMVRPAQDIEMLLETDSGVWVKRRYTIRHARPEAGEWDVDVVLHAGVGPGNRWARNAETGSRARFAGPCGKLEPRSAARHLFVGDLASLPAIAALTEALPPAQRATAIVQVESAADRLPLAAETRWLVRPDGSVDAADQVLGAVRTLPEPDGFGQVYVLGESRTVRSVRGLLEERGVTRKRIFAKAYWKMQDALPAGDPS
ncbi:Siderophore-interacting FAD-binding domain-containing protein [Streptomyces sp. DvalAA-14]|uniref:siderophore-interacting protein n=1 Tax=unclassified Streptomyces TaxID=2593676 RepID=UPI00081B020D|nr:MULTISPECIES: siderophore-interacting protein [unclassified Streptomyces]MYS21933.1 SIP domain-containing protein [Streptomyces sp. SID4948]SCE04795.1 Siderophore-interacting FAD-binding domain-containing protein [Streptomyces sp. DvalAA-14]